MTAYSLDLVYSLLGSSGECQIVLFGCRKKGFDIDNVLSGKLIVIPVGEGFRHCGVEIRIVQELFIAGELHSVMMEKRVVLEEHGWIGGPQPSEYYFSIPFHSGDLGGVDDMASALGENNGEKDGAPTPVTSDLPSALRSPSGSSPLVPSSLSSSNPSAPSSVTSHPSIKEEEKRAAISLVGIKGRVDSRGTLIGSRDKRRGRNPQSDGSRSTLLENGWFETYITQAFAIHHRVTASVIRPWYAYNEIRVSAGVTFYRKNAFGFKQTQQTVSLVIPECRRLCLLELSSRYIHIEEELQATLILKDLNQPFHCAYLMIIKAEYINCESVEEIIRVHHIFGAPSLDILQHIAGATHFSSGYIDRVDEGAVVPPTARSVVVRGTKISFAMPIRTELSICDGHASGVGLIAGSDGLTGLNLRTVAEDSYTDPTCQSTPPSSLIGTEYGSGRDSDTSIYMEESKLVVTPSIDTSVFGLTYSRALGHIERLDGGDGAAGAGADGWLGNAHSAAAVGLTMAGSGMQNMPPSAGTNTNRGNTPSPTSSVVRIAPALATDDMLSSPRKKSSDSNSGPAGEEGAHALGVLGPSPLSNDGTAPSMSSQSSNATVSLDNEHFSQTVFADSVSVRYYLRLVVQDCNRLIFWNSIEIVLYS